MADAAPATSPSAAPDFATALKVHLKVGLLSFGGPAGQIALMQQEIVERRGWVPGQTFDRGLSFAMMLPGPEAQQLATRRGLSEIRGDLKDVADEAVVLAAVQTFQLEDARLQGVRREVGLVEEALRGRRYRVRM